MPPAPAGLHHNAGMAVATRVLWVTLAALLVALAVSGVWLAFEYRPGLHPPMRRLHQVSSLLAVNVALAAAVLGVARRRQVPGLLAVPVLVLVCVASFTGFLLPWDQVALWAVTVGANHSGVVDLFGDHYRFVVIGSVEVSLATYRFWAIVHLVAVPLVAVVLAVLVVRRFRRSPAPSVPLP